VADSPWLRHRDWRLLPCPCGGAPVVGLTGDSLYRVGCLTGCARYVRAASRSPNGARRKWNAMVRALLREKDKEEGT